MVELPRSKCQRRFSPVKPRDFDRIEIHIDHSYLAHSLHIMIARSTEYIDVMALSDSNNLCVSGALGHRVEGLHRGTLWSKVLCCSGCGAEGLIFHQAIVHD